MWDKATCPDWRDFEGRYVTTARESEVGFIEVWEYEYCDDTCECVGLVLGVVEKVAYFGVVDGSTLEETDWLAATSEGPEHKETGTEYQRELKRLLQLRILLLAHAKARSTA